MTVKSGLLELLEAHRDTAVSGEAAAAELGCTRAAVWKAVKALREEGYTIDAAQNKGYVLRRGGRRISEDGLRHYLKTSGVSVRIYGELDSTNRVAREAAITGRAGHGAVFLARKQTGGRGRRGRSFYSPEDAGLYMSVVLRPERTLKDSLFLTTAAATAVYRAVDRICGIPLDIKWVNDLYRCGRKVCGILTEAGMDFESGEIQFAVVGIGLNLYRLPEGFPGELETVAGALYDSREDAEDLDVNLLAAEIIDELLREAKTGKISREYVAHNFLPGREVCIADGERSRRATALSVCPDGRLQVREMDGTESFLSYGEVSIAPVTGGEKEGQEN
ncbi:MAG: biotin--[acetyl-CoA-carboxylase] ligase [Clostridiales bacterium]|nr:biotin--[acetyl-CoA-carboxylase] ligase [Clostridiales bacterium]